MALTPTINDIPGDQRRDSFRDHLAQDGLYPLTANGIEILQLNITRKCNLSCRHCHAGGTPESSLHMKEKVIDKCFEIAGYPGIETIDLTGGAPELHPSFMNIVERFHSLGKRLLVRSNLVILLEEPFQHLPDFMARHNVEIVASLPDIHGARTDRQRGSGVFQKILEGIRTLNEIGYGKQNSGLILDLVHNPAGAYLPGSQEALESEYRRVLSRDYGLAFNKLFCLTNCPVGRYLDYLEQSGNYALYMKALKSAFNPSAARNAMCRITLSVDPEGNLHDCDFNQMLNMGIGGNRVSVFDFDYEQLASRSIQIRDHCFACTAGAGSSCQGVTV